MTRRPKPTQQNSPALALIFCESYAKIYASIV